MFTYLKSPYPYYYSFGRSIILSIGSGFFIFLFLLVFQPFGTDDFQHPYKILFLSGYGLISAIIMIGWFLVVPLILPRVFEEDHWTIGKQLTLLLVLILTLSTSCYFYQITFFNYPFNWKNWSNFIWLTISIGFFPIAFIIVLDYTIKFKKYYLPAKQLERSTQPISNQRVYVLSDEALKDKVAFTPDEFLFIKSDDNYIEVYTRRGKIDYEKKLIRCTLKSAEAVLENAGFIKCHRSYLVNPKNCSSIKGDSQGYKLYFEGVPVEIPVARAKTNEIRASLL